jgi:hypothetical protein
MTGSGGGYRGSRAHVYRGGLPMLVGVLLFLPLLVISAAAVALLLGIAVVGTLALPWALRRRVPREEPGDCIELHPDAYTDLGPNIHRLSEPHRQHTEEGS